MIVQHKTGRTKIGVTLMLKLYKAKTSISGGDPPLMVSESYQGASVRDKNKNVRREQIRYDKCKPSCSKLCE